MEDLEKHERFVSISSPSSEGGEITALGFIIGFFVNNYLFPLVLLQAKAVRTIFQTGKFSRLQRVSISSPSSEGGESCGVFTPNPAYRRVITEFPLVLLQAKAVRLLLSVLGSVLLLFPLVLLQAKAVRATFLNHDTARLSDPQIDAPL